MPVLHNIAVGTSIDCRDAKIGADRPMAAEPRESFSQTPSVRTTDTSSGQCRTTAQRDSFAQTITVTTTDTSIGQCTTTEARESFSQTPAVDTTESTTETIQYNTTDRGVTVVTERETKSSGPHGVDGGCSGDYAEWQRNVSLAVVKPRLSSCYAGNDIG